MSSVLNLEENFEEQEISQLDFAVLPTYIGATLVSGVDGDEPPIPKILGKRKTLDRLSKENLPVPRKSKGSQPECRTRAKLNIDQMRQMLNKKELEQCTFHPKISSRSKELSETRVLKSSSKALGSRSIVFDRLYKAGRENILAQTLPVYKSKPTSRHSPIENHLYSDALRRKGRETLLERRGVGRQDNPFVGSFKMQKMAGEHFVKQFSSALAAIPVDHSMASLQQIHLLLNNLAFCQTKHLYDNGPENDLIYQLYEVLAGNLEEGVRVKNLLMFLLAVMGIYNVEQVNMTEGLKSDIRGANTESDFGILINQRGMLIMDEELGNKIHRHWDVWYRNRLSRLRNQRKSQGKQNCNNTSSNRNKTGLGLKSRQSKKPSNNNSKRQSETILVQSKRQIPLSSGTPKSSQMPLPNPTYQTNNSVLPEDVELYEALHLESDSFTGVTLEIEMRDGCTAQLQIADPLSIEKAVEFFCELHHLDGDSREQIVLAAQSAFQQ